MRVYFEGLPSCNPLEILQMLRDHFWWAEQGVDDAFFAKLHQQLNTFKINHAEYLKEQGIKDLTALVSNSALTFYPQVKQNEEKTTARWCCGLDGISCTCGCGFYIADANRGAP